MTDGRLAGRVAVVTGAARGIGLAAAEVLAASGASVMACDIDGALQEEETARLAARGLDVRARQTDVADAGSVQSLIESVTAAWGRLDILVNNAAISDDTPIEDLTEDAWRHVLAVNLDSVLLCTKAALPLLRRSDAASIVNIASTQGIRGQAHAMAYATAKGGVVNLTRCMAVDFGPMGIRANAVAPGYIDTRMALQKVGGVHEHRTDWFQDVFIRHGRLPLRRPGVPADVAGPILFLAGDDSRYVTGQVLIVDGGFTCTY
ncbi:MAG TPA: SDR family NAD(P)-dependent oxidoreductase [Aestuariivirgaceae bacterium]|nr:SDR family NAD(P)-dependent oxidoreductase [Aestuariivirgaceae bacterium]